MNRIEFMEELSGLLQDIPEEDRIDALKYYNDYFDDAGSENEQNVIEELESPEKVAMKIKADREDTYQYYHMSMSLMTGKIHTEKKRIIRYIRITEPMIMKARRKSRGQTNG